MARIGSSLLRKIPTWLCGTNFCINCTSSPCFAPSFMQLRNDPKCIKTLWNSPKQEFRVQWGGLGAFVVKISDMTSWHELFSLIALVQPKLHRVSYSNETIPNAPKHYDTHQNMSLGSHGVDRVDSVQNNLMRIRGTNFCTICSSSACFAPSFMQ